MDKVKGKLLNGEAIHQSKLQCANWITPWDPIKLGMAGREWGMRNGELIIGFHSAQETTPADN